MMLNTNTLPEIGLSSIEAGCCRGDSESSLLCNTQSENSPGMNQRKDGDIVRHKIRGKRKANFANSNSNPDDFSLSVGHFPFSTSTSMSRPNSPNSEPDLSTASYLGRLRDRVTSIRRESECNSSDKEAAHEKLVKSAYQVSTGFEDICLDDKQFEERKRTRSLTEPISIFTNMLVTCSSSPSPTLASVDQKQCYSPSTQQVVRSNIPYSPSPSPTPCSPYHHLECRINRSMSPIAARQIAKRRCTIANGSDEGEMYLSRKRVKGSASPLVRDLLITMNSQDDKNKDFEQFGRLAGSKTLTLTNDIQDDDTQCSSSYHTSVTTDNSSTPFSSRANTPENDRDILVIGNLDED